MHVEKPIDLALLSAELAQAGVQVPGLTYSPTPDVGGAELYTTDAEGRPTDLPPGAEPVVAAHDASKPKRAQAFEAQEDAERMRLVAERSQADPAFAALAELTIGKQP